jgi:DivIVA domain-containing protein
MQPRDRRTGGLPVLVLFVVCLVVLVLVGVVITVLRNGSEPVLPEVERDSADIGLPAGRAMHPSDVDGLRFSLGFRGYRMAEVDEALGRLAGELADRDATIAALRHEDAASHQNAVAGVRLTKGLGDDLPGSRGSESNRAAAAVQQPALQDPPGTSRSAADDDLAGVGPSRSVDSSGTATLEPPPHA